MSAAAISTQAPSPTPNYQPLLLAYNEYAFSVTKKKPKNHWYDLMNVITKKRKQELLTLATKLVKDWNQGRHFQKLKVINNIKHALYDSGYTPTNTEKFFVMWAANGNAFAFKQNNWIFYASKDDFDCSKNKVTFFTEEGAVGGISIATKEDNEFVIIEDPWAPLKARGHYKKNDLVLLLSKIKPELKTNNLKVVEMYTILREHILPIS